MTGHTEPPRGAYQFHLQSVLCCCHDRTVDHYPLHHDARLFPLLSIAQGLWAPRTEAITETRGSLTSLRNEEPLPDGTRANGAPPRLPFANMTGHSSTQPTTTTTHNSQLTSRPSTVLPAMPPASLVGNPSDRGPRSSDLD
ncbi:hypothetical protein CKAH01_06627 [Colletotrichum kahawae]|uniref:Uncharacterized protein n=1 Tax=Colletotrichum kahawae TaxID=34407 RepID=A0AAD9Y8Y9_COLKA|nr:hypothetical protein CKAH01_06627 [Colletotrichum kahawae]